MKLSQDTFSLHLESSLKELIRYTQSYEYDQSRMVDLVYDLIYTTMNRPSIDSRVQNQFTSFLLSISNENHNDLRITLLKYFSYYANISGNYAPFKKVFHRFGISVLQNICEKTTDGTYSEEDAKNYLIPIFRCLFASGFEEQIYLAQFLQLNFFLYPEFFIRLFSDLHKQSSEYQHSQLLNHVNPIILTSCLMNHDKWVHQLLQLVGEMFGIPTKQSTIRLLLNQFAARGKILKVFKNHDRSVSSYFKEKLLA